MLTTVTSERVVDFRTRTVLRILLITLCLAITLEVVCGVPDTLDSRTAT